MHVGLKLGQENDFSATLTQNLKLPPTTSQVRAARQETLSLEDIKLRQYKLRELCLLYAFATYRARCMRFARECAMYAYRARCAMNALRCLLTVTGPDVCVRLARTASRANSLLGSDVCSIDDLAKTVKARQEARLLRYWSSSHSGKPGEGLEAGKCANAVRRSTLRP